MGDLNTLCFFHTLNLFFIFSLDLYNCFYITVLIGYKQLVLLKCVSLKVTQLKNKIRLEENLAMKKSQSFAKYEITFSKPILMYSSTFSFRNRDSLIQP